MNVKNSIIGVLAFGSNSGERVIGAQVFLESVAVLDKIAYQKTGESGKITFANLDKGVYKLFVELPRQEGKMEVKETTPDDVQVGYHGSKKLLFFQNAFGYFSIRFTKIANLANSNITPMYEPEENFRNNRIMIGKIEVNHKYGGLTLEVSSHTQRKFVKLSNKYKDDADMSIIRKSHLTT